MAVRKSVIKGVIWEIIGVISLIIWTGDWAFSAGWIIYRIVTFPAYERLFKWIRRRKYNRERVDITIECTDNATKNIRKCAVAISACSGMTPVQAEAVIRAALQ